MGMGHLALKIEDQTLARDVFIHVGSRVQGKYFGLCLNFGVICKYYNLSPTSSWNRKCISAPQCTAKCAVTRCGGNKEV